MNDLIPEDAIDFDEIIRRRGSNFDDEDFVLFKCPLCARIYLLDYEVDTAYLDPNDLSNRVPVHTTSFLCVGCGKMIPKDEAWIGAKARAEFGVTWNDLAGSGWTWVVRRLT